jgi:hypothetical protein
MYQGPIWKSFLPTEQINEEMKIILTRIGSVLLWCLVFLSLGLNLYLLYALQQARLLAIETIGEAARSISVLAGQTIQYTLPVHQDIPVRTSVAIDETLSVPVSAHLTQTVPVRAIIPFRDTLTVPVSTVIPVETTFQVPVNIPLVGQQFIAIPISATIPVSLSTPVSISREIPVATNVYIDAPIGTEATVTISHTIPVSVTVPLELEVPVTIEIARTSLQGYLERLSQELLDLADKTGRIGEWR